MTTTPAKRNKGRLALIVAAVLVVAAVAAMTAGTLSDRADNTAGTSATSVAPGTGGETAAGATAADVQRGLSVYSEACIGCHGMNGSGNLGPRLQPNSFVSGAQTPDIRALLENGRPGTQMPGFKGRLDSEEIDALISLLRSWQAG